MNQAQLYMTKLYHVLIYLLDR